MRVRKFKPFDEGVIKKELRALPHEDFRCLTKAMAQYQLDQGVGYVIKNYGNGIKMITDSGDGQGRGIFFFESASELVLLLVYKKESQSVPQSVLRSAVERKNSYE